MLAGLRLVTNTTQVSSQLTNTRNVTSIFLATQAIKQALGTGRMIKIQSTLPPEETSYNKKQCKEQREENRLILIPLRSNMKKQEKLK